MHGFDGLVVVVLMLVSFFLGQQSGRTPSAKRFEKTSREYHILKFPESTAQSQMTYCGRASTNLTYLWAGRDLALNHATPLASPACEKCVVAAIDEGLK